MSENQPPAIANSNTTTTDVPGLPFYEKSRAHLKDLVRRQQQLQRTLQLQEDTIYKKETDYLEDTPQGNIILGFENYTKGGVGVGAAGQARRGGQRVVEGNRVFSRSSVSWGPDTPLDTAQSTPGGTGAPTPTATTGFVKGEKEEKGASTPTSATGTAGAGTGNKNGTAGGTAGVKKVKRVEKGEESEGDGKEVKKVRTAFGAVAARK